MSRIWDFQVFDTFMVSVGEDASCRVWSLEDGTCLTNWEGHEGKHTWRVDVNPSGSLIVFPLVVVALFKV